MKRFSQQFNKKAQDITLSVSEKRELRERVVSYMEYHPLPTMMREKAMKVAGQEEYFVHFNFNKWRILRWSGSMMLLLVISVSYLAERAIPGDTLYAIKVGFNEELRATMALSPYEKVVWETERLNRRIAEARLLADEGKLTHEAEIEVASAIKQHSDNARREIEQLKLSDKDEASLASISLTTALNIQSTSLERQSAIKLAKGDTQSTDLIKAVLIQTQNEELNSQNNEIPAYERLIARVESETTRAHELLKGVTAYATDLEQKDIENRLNDIDNRITESMALVEADQLAARQGLVNALQQTHRLIVFMTNIDVRASLTVEDLVPDTLTTEERVAKLRLDIEEIDRLLETVEANLTASTTASTTQVNTIPAEMAEKILPSLDDVRDKALRLRAFIEGDDLTELEAVEKEALNARSTITDILTALEISVEDVTKKATTTIPVIEENENEEEESEDVAEESEDVESDSPKTEAAKPTTTEAVLDIEV